MQLTEKEIDQIKIRGLTEALKDVRILLTDIDLAEEGFLCGAYARCAEARIQSVLNSLDRMGG